MNPPSSAPSPWRMGPTRWREILAAVRLARDVGSYAGPRETARQVALIDSHCQQPPANSPLSAASRMGAVPVYPDTSWTGSPTTCLAISAALSVITNRPVPPSFTGVLAAFHVSIDETPLALVSAQTMLSLTGTQIQSNF